jgi:hypothetical protein
MHPQRGAEIAIDTFVRRPPYTPAAEVTFSEIGLTFVGKLPE